jgi:hypothetical protein
VLQELASEGVIDFQGGGRYRLARPPRRADTAVTSDGVALDAQSTTDLEKALERALDEVTERAAALSRTLRFPGFRGMLSANGGKRTAEILLDKADVSDGFTKLWLYSRDSGSNEALHLALEYIVLEGPWRVLFTPRQLDVARKRLTDVGCDLPTEATPHASPSRRTDPPPTAYHHRGSETGPTTGPVPSAWTGTVERTLEGSAFVYVLQFGSREVWKVGHTRDVEGRLADVNNHIPDEIIGEKWHVHATHLCADQVMAYDAEQAMLTELKTRRTVRERVACTRDDIDRAWLRTVLSADRTRH